MNSKTDTPSHPCAHAHADIYEEDPVFSDLQSLWDDQICRIDHLLAEYLEARLVRLNLYHSHPRRHRIMVKSLTLAQLNLTTSL